MIINILVIVVLFAALLIPIRNKWWAFPLALLYGAVVGLIEAGFEFFEISELFYIPILQLITAALLAAPL